MKRRVFFFFRQNKYIYTGLFCRPIACVSVSVDSRANSEFPLNLSWTLPLAAPTRRVRRRRRLCIALCVVFVPGSSVLTARYARPINEDKHGRDVERWGNPKMKATSAKTSTRRRTAYETASRRCATWGSAKKREMRTRAPLVVDDGSPSFAGHGNTHTLSDKTTPDQFLPCPLKSMTGEKNEKQGSSTIVKISSQIVNGREK